jgi:4-amino-4-deoxy-L-arabinose transferase-like glycosyltransferase
LLLGAAAISRQWGIFLIPPVVLLAGWRMWREQKFWPAFRTLAHRGVFCAISGSWYYLHLHRTYGSMTRVQPHAGEPSNRPLASTLAFPVAAR